MKRICRECRRLDHGRCDSVDAFANYDYCGPRPICACMSRDPEGHDVARLEMRRDVAAADGRQL